jgi:hypothetical protein
MSVNELLGVGGGLLVVVLALFLVFLSVLWILMPFAVLGIKRRLDRLIDCTERTNVLLGALAQHTETNSVQNVPRE